MVTNKYFIVAVIFVSWIIFFDQNDYMSMRERQVELSDVKDNITYLKTEIAEMNAEKKALVADADGNLNDPQKLEQYAREHYRMKHEGEDIYVLEK